MLHIGQALPKAVHSTACSNAVLGGSFSFSRLVGNKVK
jgi:hypothetical protein